MSSCIKERVNTILLTCYGTHYRPVSYSERIFLSHLLKLVLGFFPIKLGINYVVRHMSIVYIGIRETLFSLLQILYSYF